ncbi:MAG: hypothetical protein E7505_06525 [Ruminococcus sp.]|nr:hypothetical protein [Ruminococcus sp.]
MKKALILLSVMVCSFLIGCSRSENNSQIHNSDNISIIEADEYFYSKKIELNKDIKIKSISFIDDVIYYIGENQNPKYNIESQMINTDKESFMLSVMKDCKYNIRNICCDKKNEKVYYAVGINGDEDIVLSKCNSDIDEFECYTKFSNEIYPDVLWYNNYNIFFAYHLNKKLYIDIYDDSLKPVDQKIVDCFSDDSFIYDIKLFDNGKYGWFEIVNIT